MNPLNYVKEHQKLWARRHHKGVNASGYCDSIEDNLFEPLSSEVLAQFASADGNELKAKGDAQPKMHALHSSSALAVNVFHYWRERDKAPLAQAIGIPSVNIGSLEFEKRCPIATEVNRTDFRKDPNIDVVISYRAGQLSQIGIESKFSEAYGQHQGLREAYFQNVQLWEELVHCREFAESVRERPSIGLNVAQLLKHALGLKHCSGSKAFWLVYLWFATPGPELGEHYHQLEAFRAMLEKDGIRFHFLTYQELISHLAKGVAAEHSQYIDYLAGRYL